MLTKVEDIINRLVRPQLHNHYGDLKINSVERGIVRIELLGNCKGCPAAAFTIEEVIKKNLQREIPEIDDVIVEATVSQELLDFAKQILRKEKEKP